MSRIPVAVFRHDRTSSAPSSYEALQEQFQKKMLEARRRNPGPTGNYMKARPEHHSANSLSSLKHSGGSVRDFFRERRARGGDSSGALPDIHQHYKAIQTKKNGFMEADSGLNRTPSGSNAKPPLPQYRKPGSGVGIDKSKPLAPIRKSPAMLTKQDSYEERMNSLNSRHKKVSQLPAPFQKPQLARTRQWAEKHANVHDYSSGDNSLENSPAVARKNNRETGREEKLTDFQKWQIEQDKARAARLAKQNQGIQKPPPIPSIKRNPGRPARQRTPTPDPSDDDDSGHESAHSSHGAGDLAEEMVQKERHLMSLIQKQQEELKRMQAERQREEERERREQEKQRERQAAQKARQKSLEDAMRRQEEERRAAEEQRAEEERLEAERRKEEQRRKEAEKRTRENHKKEDQRRKEEERKEREEKKREEQRRKEDEKREKEERRRDEQRRKEEEKREKEERRREEQRRKEAERREREDKKREEERRKREERDAKQGNKSTYRKEPDPVDDYQPPDAMVEFYEKAAAQAQQEASTLAECPTCGRRFAADRLAKHQTICAKTSQKKRKVFDPVKARVEGTEHEKYAVAATKKSKTPPKKKNNWRVQHDNFIKSIQYAKKVSEIEAQGGDIRALTPPPTQEDPSLVPCPHCQRKFNATAAERHIPRCQNLKTKPPPAKGRRR